MKRLCILFFFLMQKTEYSACKRELSPAIPDLQPPMRSLCMNYALQAVGRQCLHEVESTKGYGHATVGWELSTVS